MKGWRAARGASGALLLLGLLLGALACDEGAQRRSGEPPRHALLVTVGHLRADRLTSFHYPAPTTYLPADAARRAAGRDLSIDGLVGRGVAFARAYTPTVHAPGALAALLTGRHPIDSWRLTAEELEALEPGTSVVEAFRSAGFRTAAFTSGFPLEAGVGLGRGFATVAVAAAESTDENTLREAAGWLDAQGPEERSFLWIHLRGLSPAQSAGGLFESDAYDEALAATNARLASFLEHLAEAGRLERTAVVLTSPGGATFEAEAARPDAPPLLDAALHVPLVLTHPRSLTGRRVFGGVVGLERVAPTLRDWFELAPAPVEGSLLPWVDGRAAAPLSPAFAVGGEEVLSLRDGDWRLVVDVRGEQDRIRLYDVRRDPAELDDVAGREPERVGHLRDLLETALDASGAAREGPRLRDALSRPLGQRP